MAEDVLGEAIGILREFEDLGLPLIQIVSVGKETGLDGLEYRTPDPATVTTRVKMGALGGTLSTIAVGDRDSDLEATIPGVDTTLTLIPPPEIESSVIIGGETYLVIRTDFVAFGDNADTAMVYTLSLTRRRSGAHSRRGSRQAEQQTRI